MIQTGINGNLSEVTGSPVVATAVNFGVGTLVLAMVSLWWSWRRIFDNDNMDANTVNPMKSASLEWYELTGGICGATNGCLVVGSAPHVGYSLAFVAVLVGQLGGSLAWDDHFRVFCGCCGDGEKLEKLLPRRPVTTRKLVGATTVLVGGMVTVAARTGVLRPDEQDRQGQTETGTPSVTVLVGLFVLLVLAGALLPTQAVVNARLNRRFAVKTTGSLISFAVGFSLLLLVYLIVKSVGGGTDVDVLFFLHNNHDASPIHWWSYAGGLFGSIMVTTIMILSPILGVSLVLCCLVCGQLLCSLVLDTIGAFGFPPLPFSILRLMGVWLALGGTFLIQWSPTVDVAEYEPIDDIDDDEKNPHRSDEKYVSQP